MINHRRNYQLIAWAWGAGWLLVSMGTAISGVYSNPNSGLTAAYGLGYAVWAIGAAVTIHYVRQQFGKNVYLTGLSIAGWSVGAFVAVVIGLLWLHTWDAGFWGPNGGGAIGGAMGGGLRAAVPGWAVPMGLAGLHAAMLASRTIRSRERGE